ncbi:MAG: acyltransferase family protein [Nesterenkonia sp.]
MPSPIPAPDTPAATAASGGRIQWIDMLRGIAVLLVVVLHGADIPYLNGNGVEEWAQVNRYLEPFRMPLLMFLSGILLPRSLAKPLRLYAWGKFAAILWPLLLWILLFGLFIYQGGIESPAFWRSGGDYLWFLTALTICYLIGVGLKPLVRSGWAFVLAALGLFAAMLLTRHFGELDTAVVSRTLYNGAFFFLGAACVRAVPRWIRAPGSVVLVLGIIAVVISYMGADDRWLRTGTLYAVPGSVIGIAVAIWLASRVRSGLPLTFLAWVGRSSIVVYIVHFPAAVLTHRLMILLGADPITHTIACTTVSLVVSVVAVALRSRTPWLYLFPHSTRIQQRLNRRAETRVRVPR